MRHASQMRKRMREHLNNSLMLVTALNPVIA